MKKITLSIFGIFFAALLLYSCKSAVQNEPKAVAQAFFEELAKQNLDGAAQYATKESKQTIDIMKKSLKASKQDAVADSSATDPFKNLVFSDAKIDGDKASIEVYNQISPDATYQVIPLIKQEGMWKVDFSMKTLIAMGKAEAKKFQGGVNEISQDTTSTASGAATDKKEPAITDSTSIK